MAEIGGIRRNLAELAEFCGIGGISRNLVEFVEFAEFAEFVDSTGFYSMDVLKIKLLRHRSRLKYKVVTGASTRLIVLWCI